ncbi:MULTISPECIES: glycosyltransferase family 4 protein [unclassified Nostoc]|uniref:glycosyltransferase family 4 protein n=1 Tax=unclassified Nostoc TaxID=2593658 RepID=UPI0025AAB697|nr:MULTISPECIES: glycosyltransferase family 4 protein [unclassified Nostoc]MDM9580594.1 glycosyltransferase family 4 protein [Nostoc sp. GT001]MDZ7945908.1 glycosyltransferase family 4 protein [Nostoc sp. EfeVER01]MDZ7990672.1 glycosyltransferase family 4 protein [Nostoc sp. EspVER01]
MKILHISTHDINGGAARAAYRLHTGLQDIGLQSQMLVQEKYSNDKTVIAPKIRLFQGIAKAKLTVESLPLKLYRQKKNTPFFTQWLPDRVIPKVAQINPDIINLHWISGGFMQIETFAKLKRPLVWTLHDMWGFTGGCHVTGECDRYKVSCGACPQLSSGNEWDLSRWVWQRKVKAWKNLNLTLVSPSSWLAQCARSSSLFQNLRIEVIPHGLDTQKYRPINQRFAREALNLPQDKKLILFGAIEATSDRNKGFHLLQPALQELSKSGWKDDLEVVIFGASQPENPPDLGFKTHYLGHLHDAISLATVYSAADVMLVPSLQESFGQTASESFACGTPVVAFNATGLKDIVDHQQNGYLAKPYEVEDFAKGITWVLENEQRLQKLSFYARDKAEQEFTLELQARRYSALFQEILMIAKKSSLSN